MAIFHSHGQVIGKSTGRSAVAAAAYRSGSKFLEQVIDAATGIVIEQTWDYTKKGGVVFSQIIAPEHAPEWVYDREKLWNQVTKGEKRERGQLAREFDIALPMELTKEQNAELIIELAIECFVKHGMVADVNMHYDNPNNPHAHVMLTMRDLVKFDDGIVDFGLKNREWNSKAFLSNVREQQAVIINKHLELHGFENRVSHLSHKERGIDLDPQLHVGPAGSSMKESDRREQNAEIIRRNAQRISEKPELILDRLTINKPVFTKEEIAIALSKELLIARDESGNIGEDLNNQENLELLNKDLSSEFMAAYSKVLASKHLSLIVEEDLKGRTLYALTKRVELEQRFLDIISELTALSNHSIGINEKHLAELSIREKLIDKLQLVTKSVDKKLAQTIGTNFGLDDESRKHLTDEQKKAVLEILNGNDLVILEGLPGTGKTTVMREIVRQYKKAGMRVIGAAPSSAAALNLAGLAGIEAKNTSQWRAIWQRDKGEKFELALRAEYYKEEQYQAQDSSLSPKDILIIDEASMVELSCMDYLLSEAKRAKAKVILVGDNNQFAAIGMQGALNKASAVAQVSRLAEVRRQKNPEQARATELLGEYKIAEALEIYSKEGCFSIHGSERETKAAIIKDYIEAYFEKAQKVGHDNLAASRSIVICAHTNEAVNEFNNSVREKLKKAGIIKGREENYLVGAKWLKLARGEQIVFDRNDSSLGVLNGEVGTVLKCSTADKLGRGLIKIVVNKADGSSKVISLDTFEYGYNRLTKSPYSQTLSYGYAVTGYKLQGASVDQLLVYYESMVGYEAFNVMMTRHREKVVLYANSVALEDIVYKRLALSATEAREESIINAKEELWLIGLAISVSKRTNLSFISDYIDMGLSAEDKTLKLYIESRANFVQTLRQIAQWQEKEYRRTGIKPPPWQHEAWKIALHYKSLRKDTAKEIFGKYSDFKDRIIQLDLNFETIRKHSGTSNYEYEVINKDNVHTIANNASYKAIISICEELGNNKSLEINFTKEEGNNFIRKFNNHYLEVEQDISETKIELIELNKSINNLSTERYEIEDSINKLEEYRTKLIPQFLKRTYKDASNKVLDKWQKLVQERGVEKALLDLTNDPKILGNLNGIGIGAWVGLNSSRIDAIKNIEGLSKRFKEYEESVNSIKEAKEFLLTKDYLEQEQVLLERKVALEQILPYKTEKEFLKAAGIALEAIGSLKQDDDSLTLAQGVKILKELAVSEITEAAILDFYNYKNPKNPRKAMAKNEMIAKSREKGNENELNTANIHYGEEKDMGSMIKKAAKPNNKATIEQEIEPKEITELLAPVRQKRSRRTRENNNLEKFKQLRGNRAPSLSFTDVKAALSASIAEKIFRQYAGMINNDGKIIKKGQSISCGSLTMDLKSNSLGLWYRFSTSQKGDIFEFVREATGSTKYEALKTIAECLGIEKSGDLDIHNDRKNSGERENLLEQKEQKTKEPVDVWLAYKTIPKIAPRFAAEKHLNYMQTKNEIAAIYPYHNSARELIGYCVRLVDKQSGKKQVLPVSYCHNAAMGQKGWRFKGFTDELGHKPIYGLEKVGQDLKTILIVEGEKTADKAQELLPEYTVISWLGGSNAAANVNWSKLQGRDIVIWPDNDRPGFEAANIIAEKLGSTNSNIGSISIIKPNNLNLPEKWDLADSLPAGIEISRVREEIVKTQERSRTLDYTNEVGKSLQSMLEGRQDELKLAQKILWQNRSKGQLLSEQEVQSAADEYKGWQSTLGSPEALYYTKYAETRGFDGSTHEFLKLEHPLYRDTLVAIATNSNIKGKEELKLTDLISTLQDEHQNKLRSSNIGNQLSNNNKFGHDHKLLEIKPDRQETFSILVRDIALLHQQELAQSSTLSEDYINQLSATAYKAVNSYQKLSIKGSNSDKLSVDDKIKIAEELHKTISSKEWWQELTKERIGNYHQQIKAEEKDLELFLKLEEAKLADMVKIEPKYDIAKLKNTLREQNPEVRDKVINKEWLRVFKDYALPQLKVLSKEKEEAKTIEEIMNVLAKEKEFCVKIHKDHWEAAHQLKYQEGNNQMHSIYFAHQNKPELLKSLQRDASMLDTLKLWPEGKLLKELQNTTSLGYTTGKIFKECQAHYVKEVNKDLAEFKHNNFIERDGRKFESSIAYLQHKLDDSHHLSVYLKGSSIEKHLEKHDHDHYGQDHHLQNQQRQTERQQQKELEKNMDHDLDIKL